MSDLNFKKYIYPLASSVFAVVVLLVFYLLVRFLFIEINMIFQDDEELVSGGVVEYRMENFKRIKKKFERFAVNPEDVNKTNQESSASEPANGRTNQEKEPIEKKILDKKNLSIQVLNGRGTSGLAGRMKKNLEVREFVVESIGNAERTQKTTLKIKESKKDFMDMLKEASEAAGHKILKVETLAEDSKYDSVIIIGRE